MKLFRLYKQTIAVVIMLILALVAPTDASAKFSKASSHFSCGQVEVKVFDRHDMIGRSHTNTYGYTEYTNHNDYEVIVNWRAYGVRKGDHKLVLVDEGTINIMPKKTHSEVYSYTAVKYVPNDFETYVVAIEPSKANAAPAPEPTKMRSKDLDEIYSRVTARDSKGTLDQQDYTDALDWMDYMFKNQINPLLEKAYSLHKRGEDNAIKDLYYQNEDTLSKWRRMGKILQKADKKGKLNAENSSRFKALMNDFQALGKKVGMM